MLFKFVENIVINEVRTKLVAPKRGDCVVASSTMKNRNFALLFSTQSFLFKF